MSNKVIYEELTPSMQLVFETDAAYIESSKIFNNNDFQMDKSELQYATSLGLEINSYLPQLYEQELIQILNGKIKIPYETFSYLYQNDDIDESSSNFGFDMSEVLPKYSPFFINIDSYRDLGSPDFEYDCKFHWGIKQVFPKRYGCFLKHRHKFYYLDDNLFKLLSKIDEFNGLDKLEKNKKINLRYFAEIKQRMLQINNIVKIDTYINNENVVIPDKVKLNIIQNGDVISVEPMVEGTVAVSFQKQYELLDEVQEIYDTNKNGERVRIILSDDVKEVAKKLKNEYSKITGNQKDKIMLEPRKVISEIEGIDQDVIDYEGYSERVKGIGYTNPIN